MDFTHTQDRRMFSETLNKFLSDNYDYMKRNEWASLPNGYNAENWQQFAELGFVGALFEEKVGGFGGSGHDIAVIFEELGKAIVVEPFLANLVAGSLLGDLAGDTHSGLLEEIIAGEKTAAFAHTEAMAGYEPAYVGVTAVQADNGDWTLNGNKGVVISGDSADVLLVSARTFGNETDHEGISVFLVDPKAQGLSLRGYGTVDGYRAGDITLKDVTLAPDRLLGAAGKAFPSVEKALARGTLAVCAEALGAMTTSVMITNEFIKTRKQFGVPIGKFQALQHRMAEMLIELEQVRSGVINAAGNLDSPAKQRQWYLSAAKNLVGRIGRLVSEETIQMHGGIGMTWEYSIAHFAKRLVMIDHLFGDEDYHLHYIVKNPL